MHYHTDKWAIATVTLTVIRQVHCDVTHVPMVPIRPLLIVMWQDTVAITCHMFHHIILQTQVLHTKQVIIMKRRQQQKNIFHRIIFDFAKATKWYKQPLNLKMFLLKQIPFQLGGYCFTQQKYRQRTTWHFLLSTSSSHLHFSGWTQATPMEHISCSPCWTS